METLKTTARSNPTQQEKLQSYTLEIKHRYNRNPFSQTLEMNYKSTQQPQTAINTTILKTDRCDHFNTTEVYHPDWWDETCMEFSSLPDSTELSGRTGLKQQKYTSSNLNPGVKSQTNDTHKNIKQNLQSPRILGAPTAALTQISKAIISFRGRNSSERFTGVETERVNRRNWWQVKNWWLIYFVITMAVGPERTGPDRTRKERAHVMLCGVEDNISIF